MSGIIDRAKTAKGQATRERIVAAASRLIAERGIADTSLDDVIKRAGVSKGQLYHYFEDRAALLHAVVAHNTDAVLRDVGRLDGWKSIRTWFDQLVELQIRCHASGGCPIGSLVGQLAEVDEEARRAIADGFDRWETCLRDGLRSMKARGQLGRRADPRRLATATMATVQGGMILTQTRRDPTQLAIALDAAYAHLRAHATPRSGGARTVPGTSRSQSQ